MAPDAAQLPVKADTPTGDSVFPDTAKPIELVAKVPIVTPAVVKVCVTPKNNEPENPPTRDMCITGLRTGIGLPAESVKVTFTVANVAQVKSLGLEAWHVVASDVVATCEVSNCSPLVFAGKAGVKNVPTGVPAAVVPAISAALFNADGATIPVVVIVTVTPEGVVFLAPPVTAVQVPAGVVGI